DLPEPIRPDSRLVGRPIGLGEPVLHCGKPIGFGVEDRAGPIWHWNLRRVGHGPFFARLSFVFRPPERDDRGTPGPSSSNLSRGGCIILPPPRGEGWGEGAISLGALTPALPRRCGVFFVCLHVAVMTTW